MANINVTFTENTITVDETTSNVTVTETVSNIVFSAGAVSLADVRTAISNTSPITYDNISGIIGINNAALFTGKTTDDLNEGSTNQYFTNARVGAYLTSNFTTTDIPEGANLYFTAARARSAVDPISPNLFFSDDKLALNGNISVDSVLINNTYKRSSGYPLTVIATQGQQAFSVRGNVDIEPEWSTDPIDFKIKNQNARTVFRVQSSTSPGSVRTVTVDGNISQSNGTITSTGNITTSANIAGNFFLGNGSVLTGVNAQVIAHIATVPLTVGGNLTVNGNINATGNINVQNVEDLYVRDQTIVMNANAASPANVQIVSNRPGFANTEIKWNEQDDRWTFTNDGTTYYNLATSTTDVAEGTNLYYTTDRANTAIDAYQGNINTPGAITAGTITAGTISGDGSNIQYVRAFSADLVTDSGALPLNVILESQSNNRLAKANGDSITYVPSTRTMVVTDGTIGSSASNTNFSGVNLTLAGNINAEFGNIQGNYILGNGAFLTGIMSSAYGDSNVTSLLANLGSNAITGTGNITAANITCGNINAGQFRGNGVQITAITGANVFGLVSTQVSEGTNLYFTTDRANTAIDDYVVGSENIDVSSGAISLANALGNVNSITAELGQNHTLISDTTLLQSRVRNNSVVNAANVEGLGFAIYGRTTNYFSSPNFPFISYSGTDEIKLLVFDGDATAGSNVITITNIYDAAGNIMAVSNVKQYYGFSEFPGAYSQSVTFPEGTYVTSVSGSNVYMSANALTTTTFYADLSFTAYSLGALFPMAYDTVTDFGLALNSAYNNALSGIPPGSATTINNVETNRSSPFYAYPESGPVKADLTFPFDTANFSVASFSGVTLAKTNIGASKTVPAFTRGLTVGAGDLTNRGIGDTSNPTFGLNILWDGTANVTQEYSSPNGIFPQIMLRSFSDGTAQGISGNTSANWSVAGPRLLFINGNGNANDPILSTYALENQELGKIGWTSTTAFTSSPSTTGPAAYITAISNKNQTTGPGDVGLYLVASPTTSGVSTNQIGSAAARLMWAGHHKSNTIISAGSRTNGTSGDIIFAPGRQAANQGNAVAMSELIVNSASGSPHWAKMSYDNPSSNTGAKVSVTNGFNTTVARNGNITLVLDRNDNGAGFGSKEWAFKLQPGSNSLVLTEDDVIRTTFADANITTAGNVTASTFLGNVNGATATLSGNAVITGNVNLGTNATINYDAVYGCFHNMANVTAAAADTVYEFQWPNVHINTNRVTVESNSQITIGQEGAYVFNLEMQAENTDNQDRTAFIWLAKNGTDIEESCVRVTLLKEWKQVIVKEWIVNSLNANDYIEVRFAVDNPSGIQLTSIPAQASPYARPAVPSAVITVTPVGV